MIHQYLLFFFQAEDGIRDKLVTGVQTCALPISMRPDPRQWLTAAEVFEAGTIGGARALGLERRIGRIEPGYKADLVFLDLTSINYMPLNEPLLHVVFCEDGTGIDRVMIGGRMVVEGGAVLGIDMA